MENNSTKQRRANSIVAEALQSAGTLRKETVDELMENLRRNALDVCAEVCRIVQQKYGKYLLTSLTDSRHLNEKITKVVEEVEKTKKKIEAQLKFNVDSADEKLKKLESDLENTRINIAALTDVAELSDRLEEIDETLNVARRADLLVETELKLNSILISANNENRHHSSTFVIDKNALSCLSGEFVTQRERLTYELSEMWKNVVRYEINDEIVLELQLIKSDDRDSFQLTLNALSSLDILTKKVGQLAKFLLSSLLFPLIDADRLIVTNAVDSTLTIRAARRPPTTARNAEEIVADLRSLLDCLINLFSFRVKNEKHKNFLALLGAAVGEPMLGRLVEKVLHPAVPSGDGGEQETKNFETLLAQCETLETRLKNAQFLPENTKSFAAFASDVDSLFLNKKCQTILKKARILITSNLHDTTETGDVQEGNFFEGDDQDWEDAETSKAIGELLTMDAEMLTELRRNTPVRFDNEKRLPCFFRFPKCRISQNVVDLLKLIVCTLDEARNSMTPASAGRLYETSRRIFELYVAVTPAYHKRALLSLPLLPAIFFNNCCFLSHHASTLGVEYSVDLFKSMSLPTNCMRITFVDFVPVLRQMAVECMKAALDNQTLFLQDCMKSVDGFSNLNEVDKLKSCTKAVKQCVMQIQLLHRIWKPVLTTTVLFKSLAFLVSNFLTKLSNCVLDAEDIAADDATRMKSIFVDSLKLVEDLFVIENGDKSTHIHRYCESSYLQFKEICFLLSASLQEIDDRWAAGGGPLATWMLAEDVKHIVRALFQNTEKRSSLLSKIKSKNNNSI